MTRGKEELKIALPVMLQFEDEIESYKKARDRIGETMEDQGYKVDVGVFCYMIPFTLDEEAKRKQRENLKGENLPIYHAQLPIMYENALTHDDEEVEKFGKDSRLEEGVKQVKRLAEISGTNPEIDCHMGALVSPHLNERHPYPGVYSVDGFLESREDLLSKARRKFEELDEVAGDLSLVLENEPTVTYEPFQPEGGENALIYWPFANPEDMNEIAERYTFDVSHFGSNLKTPEKISDNNIDSGPLFELLDIDGWEEYRGKFENVQDYIKKSAVFHLSNTRGIGVHLSDPQEIERWGNSGTKDGVIGKRTFRNLLDKAYREGIPTALELNYDLENLDFREADAFLDHIYSKD